jgi:hypothetical protein
MSMPVTGVVVDDESSTVCWGAVIGGGIAAAAVTLILLAFGVGVGFTVVSPWNDQGVSATTLHVGAGVYLVVVAMLSSTIGGYLAGRLRHRWSAVHQDEVYFRDTAHGFLAWALATLLSASALGGATTHILAGASAGSIPAAVAGASTTNNNNGGPNAIYVDRMLRTDVAPAAGAASPAGGTAVATTSVSNNGNAASSRGELSRLLAGATVKGGNIAPADRAYASKIVMMRTGVNQQEADQRVNAAINDAKKAADDARKVAATMSLWLAGALLAGALAAALAATEGGLLRDSKWYETGWRAGPYGAERGPR